MNQRKPDFFIVGPPKCGTAARKDITHFGADLHFSRPRISREEYLSLFRNANDALQIGESSVWYMYSTTAAEEIKPFAPTASILVMPRNPVDMLYAQHSQFLCNCNEDQFRGNGLNAIDSIFPTSNRSWRKR